jgi:hypothetical protein
MADKHGISEVQMAAIRAYVGQTDMIDGVFDPMSCTLTKPDGTVKSLREEEEQNRLAMAEAASKSGGLPQPEQELTLTERQAKKNKKKREKKKKKAALARNGKQQSALAEAQQMEGWHTTAMSAPSPALVKPEKPMSRDDALRGMGFGRREREKLETFQRLTRLTGLADRMPELQEGVGAMGPSLQEELQSLVDTGGTVRYPCVSGNTPGP